MRSRDPIPLTRCQVKLNCHLILFYILKTCANTNFQNYLNIGHHSNADHMISSVSFKIHLIFTNMNWQKIAKMTVFRYHNYRNIRPKWPYVYRQNDRYMTGMTVSTKITVTKMTGIHHKNYRYLKNTEMTIILIQKSYGHSGLNDQNHLYSSS